MRFNYNAEATVKRLSAYSSDKSSYAAVSGTIRGSFNPIEPGFKTEQLQIMGQAYQFTTDGRTKDIRVNDVLTISAVEYKVKGVARYALGAIDELRITLEISVTQ